EANRAYVNNPYRDYEIKNGSWKYKDIDYLTGDDNGGYFGGKRYSFVEVKLAVLSTAGTTYNYSLSFDVDVTGEYHIKTTFGTTVDTKVES
ncbi:MAG: hypothetical protein HDR72_03350, partial [Ruminococcaceae bacterium]|nr:hypothetical protein [Oscillospiraceae bacterium]